MALKAGPGQVLGNDGASSGGADRFDLLLIGCVLVAYACVYSLGLFPWDDQDYLAAASANNGLVELCSNIVLGNYHPLTMLSLALCDVLGGGAPWVQHLMNVLLHLGSCLLVRRIVQRLTDDGTIAMGVALLFAVHPVHVESVAWIAERKNVLYAFFYFLSILRYMCWLERPSPSRYTIVLICAVLAMLSKAQAVTLPFALLAVALIEQRSFHLWRQALRLMPLFGISLFFGLLAVHAQQTDDYLHPERTGDLVRTIVLACYALVSYAARLLVPIGLSIFHPFPAELTWVHYSSVGLVAAGVMLLVRSIRQQRYLLVGCALFFVVDLFPLLQFVPVGEALTADRYAYVASVPFFLLVAHGLRSLAHRSAMVARPIAIASAGVVLLFGYITNRRAAVWDGGPVLFERLAEDHPGSDIAQYNLAVQYQGLGLPDLALERFARTVELNPGYAQAWYAMGKLLRDKQEYEKALNSFDQALRSARGHPNEYLCHYDRGLCYKEMDRTADALKDSERALVLAPEFAPAWYLRGMCLATIGRHAEAMAAYDQAERWGYDRTLIRMNRAISRGWTGDHAGAIHDLDLVVAEGKASAEVFFLRGIAKIRSGADGCLDLKHAAAKGHQRAVEAGRDLCQ